MTWLRWTVDDTNLLLTWFCIGTAVRIAIRLFMLI